MATYNQLVAKIDELLSISTSKQLLQLNSTTKEKAFEVYALSLIADAVRRAGGNVTIQGINSGANPSPIVFRAAPGAIYSTLQDFAYLDCTLNEKEFEIHIDIQFEGNSGASHEMDVCLIEDNHAETCRRGNRNPKKTIYISECKFYSSSTPSIGLARALVGLISDVRPKIGSSFISNGATNNLKKYLSGRNRPDPFIDLSPLNSTSEERFINNMESKLRKWASV